MNQLGNECPTCSGVGTLGISPEGERIYCDDCVYGVTLHLDEVTKKGKGCSTLLHGWEALGCASEDDVAAAREYLWNCLEEHRRLSVRLDELKQDETNRPVAHLFEGL